MERICGAKQIPEQAWSQPLSLPLPCAAGPDPGQASCALHPHPEAHCRLARSCLAPATSYADIGSPAWGPSLCGIGQGQWGLVGGTWRGPRTLSSSSGPPTGSVSLLQGRAAPSITAHRAPIRSHSAHSRPSTAPLPPSKPQLPAPHLGTHDSTTPGWPWPSSQ